MNDILLLHGALGSKSQFLEVEESLSNDFNIHTMNFSGHGGESIPGEPFSIEMFASDVIEYLEINAIKSIDIFGYSMGGYTALYLAKTNPQRIRKIFTLATKFEWNEEISAREIKMLNSAKIKEKIPKFAEELFIRHTPQNWETVLAKTSEMMVNLGKRNVLTEEDFSLIENDVLVGIGDRDKMVSFEESIAVYRRLKNGRIIVLPDTPHPLEQVNAKRLVYEIKNFF